MIVLMMITIKRMQTRLDKHGHEDNASFRTVNMLRTKFFRKVVPALIGHRWQPKETLEFRNEPAFSAPPSHNRSRTALLCATCSPAGSTFVMPIPRLAFWVFYPYRLSDLNAIPPPPAEIIRPRDLAPILRPEAHVVEIRTVVVWRRL